MQEDSDDYRPVLQHAHDKQVRYDIKDKLPVSL